MQYGSAGVGSANHVACLLLNSAIGVDVTHVPYRDNAIPDLIAGRVDYFCLLTATAVPLIENRSVKGIAVLSKARISVLPELATAQEQGLAGFDASNWNAVFLPKGAPATVVQKLHEATSAAIEITSVRQRMNEAGVALVPPDRRSPGYLQTFVETEIKKWAAPIKSAGVTSN